MGSRGQKRAEIVDELPADKRACSSLEFRPSTSSSPGEPNFRSTNLVPETSVADMDTSSSNSGSSHSDDEEPDRDSAYGSFDSGSAGLRHSSLRDYQRRRSSGDQGKLKSALNGLSEGSGTSEQIAALTELCEVLSFCTEDSLSSVMVELLSPVLVRLARHDSNPDIMLLAIRALTYLCDVFPRASGILARHDAIPALCQRLMAVEYMDVAEQCLQALEIISRDQSLACLQMGAIMAVLSFIDFFPTSVQRVALLTVVNICKNLPKEYPSSLMEAVPTLCNLLQYEDRQLVENVAICLIKIAERASESSEKLDDLCKHGLVNQATCLIRINSRTTLSQPIYNGLIALLVKLSSKSSMAIETLFELDISSILKDILDAHDFSHGITSSHVIDGQGNKVHEVLKLLNELLPSTVRDPHAQQQMLDKESFLVSHPDLLDKFGADILPILSQVVNCGANLYICYGCLSVIKKLVYFSKSDQLVELLKNANIPSFLAGVFTRKDHHVLLLALQITEIILQKHSDAFIHFFVKEGVFFAIETLLKPEKCPRQMFPVSNGIQLPCDSGHKSFSKTVLRCLCYAFDNGQLLSSAESGTCQIETDCVHKLAKHIKTTYVSTQLYDGEKGLTDIFQNFRSLSSALVDLSAASLDTSSQNVEKFYGLLCEIMSKLNGKEPVSTFEFIESGIVKSLANYMSSGWCLRDEVENNMEEDYLRILEERFEVFSRLFSSTSDRAEELPVSILIQKLQCALASLENLPVILNHVSKNRHFVHVPYGRCTSYPCLRVRFKRGEETSSLSDYSQDALTVDPFSTLEAIEGFLLPKVRMRSSSQLECVGVVKLTESMLPPSQLGSNFSQGESSRSVHSEGISVDQQMLQENDPNLSCVSPEKMATLTPGHFADSISENDDQNVSAVRVVHGSSRACAIYDKNASSPSKVDALQKLTFYLEGQPLDRTCTLYQAILQQKIKADDESNLGGKLWNHIYTLTYVLAVEPKVDDSEESLNTTQEPSLSDEIQAYMQNTSFIRRIFSCELASDLDKSTATYDILFLLRVLESLNRFTFHLMSHRRLNAFAEGLVGNLNDLRVVVRSLPQNEFVSSKLTEKLEQQMRDSCAVSAGGMPLWCSQLMSSCPFLFGFEVRCKYFRLVAFGSQQVPPQPSSQSSNFSRDRRPIASSSVRKKLIVYRDRVLESAVQMMELNAQVKEPIEVLYNEEVGTGLGPTLEFYTLVGHEFQKFGLGMWRGDHTVSTAGKSLGAEYSGSSMPASGIFPRPWSPTADTSNGSQFSEVIKKFTLLGQVVAKALQDGRVLDMSFSKAFYKLMLQEELNLYDIQSFDPDLGGTLLEFQAIVNRKRCVGSAIEANFSSSSDACFRNTRIEDLCLDFTLPGYTDYILPCGDDNTLVSMTNLEKYVTLVVDATINAGIRRQVEAFKSGFNLIFPIEHLRIFTEEELERLLCGERDFWAFNELMDHIKLDHGYTVSSPPVVNLLEILQEFSYEQQRGFLQFVTGAPRLPPGGLTSLNPKLTIVRKHCSGSADADLPSVMTCANYLKLPPYSSKEKMKEKLLYAITEGQGSFHLS